MTVQGNSTMAVDLLIIGAGPAGMAAAVEARAQGLSVTLLDEQQTPGGQIWRNVAAASAGRMGRILGGDYIRGARAVARFRACGADYRPGTRVWHIEEGGRVFFASGGRSGSLQARTILLATGAQERPAPFPGWTLPGVMGVGAAQVTLKSAGQLPDGPLWIAGCGPLAYLYAMQLLRAGGKIAGFLDTTPPGRLAPTLGDFRRAVAARPGMMLKGALWQARLRRRVPFIPHVSDLSAEGEGALQRLRYRSGSGPEMTVRASCLLVHEGLVPGIHPMLGLGCTLDWNGDQDCFVPRLDAWGESSVAGVFVAGDAAGIAGAEAACLRGQLAAQGVVRHLRPDARQDAAPGRRAELARALAIRPFLDRYFRPRDHAFEPPDRTLICRCEAVSAATIRGLSVDEPADPNRVKAYSRAGMGACQGRQCNYAVARLIAGATGCRPAEVGVYRARPPLKPVSLAELAALQPQENLG